MLARKTHKELLSEYFLNEYYRITQDIKAVERDICMNRYTDLDVARLQLLRTRYETFTEIVDNVMILLRISEKNIVDYASEYADKIRRKENRNRRRRD